MQALRDWLTLISVVVVIVAALTSVTAFLRASVVRAQMEGLRNDRDDLTVRTERLEHENELLERDVQQLRSQNNVLKDLVTGKQQLDHLQEQLDSHDRRVDEKHTALLNAIKALTIAIERDRRNERGT